MALLLYSCGSSLIAEFEECIAQNKLKLAVVVRNLKNVPVFSDHSHIIDAEEITDEHQSYPFLVPLFTPRDRFHAYYEALQKSLTPYRLLTYPQNNIATSLKHGVGCFINAAVVIGAQTTLGNNVLINRGVSIGHHVNLENFVSIGPSATLCGNIHMGTGAVIGAGAVILPKIKIGAHGVRFGLEDNLYMDLERKQLATNLHLVERVHALAKPLNRQIMSAKQCRKLLAIT